MNQWQGEGGLTRDLEIKDINGVCKVEFTLAVKGARYDGKQRAEVVTTTWVGCEAWGPVAERILETRVGKGGQMYVVGGLTQASRDGEDRPHTRVAVRTFEVLRLPRGASPLPPAAPAADPYAPQGDTPATPPPVDWSGSGQ